MTASEFIDKEYPYTEDLFGNNIWLNIESLMEDYHRMKCKEQSILELLFAVKNKLEGSKDKKDLHTLSFLSEAIKWQQSKK